MYRRIALFGWLVAIGTTCLQGQVNFTGTYHEDFDGLGPSGRTYPDGWNGVRWSGIGVLGEELELGVTTGTTRSGGIFNVGSDGDADRALGSLSSGSTVPLFGVRFVNATDQSIEELWLGGAMEQWRTANDDSVDELLRFEYSLDASSVYDPAASWLVWPEFDLPEALTDSTGGSAVDGNQSENRLILSGVLTGIEWNPTEALTIRWSDSNDAGSDGLYALDDFSLRRPVASVPEPSVHALFGITAIGMLAFRFRQRKQT